MGVEIGGCRGLAEVPDFGWLRLEVHLVDGTSDGCARAGLPAVVTRYECQSGCRVYRYVFRAGHSFYLLFFSRIYRAERYKDARQVQGAQGSQYQ